jgi:hypothetical protein
MAHKGEIDAKTPFVILIAYAASSDEDGNASRLYRPDHTRCAAVILRQLGS